MKIRIIRFLLCLTFIAFELSNSNIKTLDSSCIKNSTSIETENYYDAEYMYEMAMRTYSKQQEIIDTQEQIEEEIYEGELELLAQLVRAEAGNQPLEGKRAVVDVVLNRVDSDLFPNTISEVIFQEGQFSCIKDGGFDKAAWTVDDSDFEAVMLEISNRTDCEIMFFSSGNCANGVYAYSIGDHYFAKLR